jgi:hypothetical protein
MAFEQPKVREVLANLASKRSKLLFSERLQLINIGHRELRPVIKWIVEKYQLTQSSVAVIPDGLRRFIRSLSLTSPVCSYLDPSEFNVNLIRSLTKEPIRRKVKELHYLQMELPIFFDMVIEQDVGVLPDCFTDLLSYLIIRAESPFNSEHRVSDLPPSADNPLAWYGL